MSQDQDYQSPTGEAGFGLALDLARALTKAAFLVLFGSL